MNLEKGNTQTLFHFILSQLIVECSEHIKNHEEVDNKLKEIGAEVGFKIYNQICLKRGIQQRTYNLTELFKNIKSKVFKHLFNYQLTSDTQTYRIEQKNAVVYGIIDQFSVYLAWMPDNCQVTASMLVAGIIEGVCRVNEIKCSVSSRKVQSQKEDKIIIEYLIEIDGEENAKWDRR